MAECRIFISNLIVFPLDKSMYPFFFCADHRMLFAFFPKPQFVDTSVLGGGGGGGEWEKKGGGGEWGIVRSYISFLTSAKLD